METSAEGACKGFPTQWWFPEDNSSESRANVVKAVAICAGCQIRKQCLTYALENETHGVWGGMKEVEREIHRRKLGVQLTERALSSQSTTVRRVTRRLAKDEAIV